MTIMPAATTEADLVERLTKLHDLIAEEEHEVDMTYWWADEVDGELSDQGLADAVVSGIANQCGTAACFAGGGAFLIGKLYPEANAPTPFVDDTDIAQWYGIPFTNAFDYENPNPFSSHPVRWPRPMREAYAAAGEGRSAEKPAILAYIKHLIEEYSR